MDTDAYITFEHVEILDVLRCETLDQRTVGSVFFRGELAAEDLLAPFSRDDGGVILRLNEKQQRSFVVSPNPRPRRTARAAAVGRSTTVVLL